jgi:hypothetical protein
MASPISVPRPLSPADGTKFAHFPRTVTLAWEVVPSAKGYKVEIEFDGSSGSASPHWTTFGSVKNLNATTYTFDFIAPNLVAGECGLWMPKGRMARRVSGGFSSLPNDAAS